MPTQLFSGSREWLADYERIKVKRDALAQEYGATYPKIVAQLVDLFGRAEAVEKEVLRINGSAPDGESRRLLGVEQTARGLERFTTANPSITLAVKLPDFERSTMQAWPPPKPSMAVQVATSITYGSHPRANWWQESKERASTPA